MAGESDEVQEMGCGVRWDRWRDREAVWDGRGGKDSPVGEEVAEGVVATYLQAPSRSCGRVPGDCVHTTSYTFPHLTSTSSHDCHTNTNLGKQEFDKSLHQHPSNV